VGIPGTEDLLLFDRVLDDAACAPSLRQITEPRSQMGWDDGDDDGEPQAQPVPARADEACEAGAALLEDSSLPERLRIAHGPRATRYYRTVRLAFGGQVVELEKSISRDEFERLRGTPGCLVQEGRRRVRAPVRELTHGSAPLAEVPTSDEGAALEIERVAVCEPRPRSPGVPRALAAGTALCALAASAFAAFSIWLGVQSLQAVAADEAWYSAIATPVRYSSH
jgi:hypothetical protein